METVKPFVAQCRLENMKDSNVEAIDGSGISTLFRIPHHTAVKTELESPYHSPSHQISWNSHCHLPFRHLSLVK